jgi:hypothetical protein
MTDSIRVLDPGWRALDANGDVYSGAVLHFFDAGTSTPRTVYSDSGLSTSLGVTVTCDSGGYPTSDGNAKTLIYTGTTAYKVTLKNSAGTTIWSHDNIAGALDTTPFAAATFAKPDTDCSADTANTTLTTDDLGTVRNGNPTGGTFTYTLPSAITATNGRGYTFRHVGTANSIIIATVAAQTIDGATTKTISSRYETLEIVSDGANWHVKGDANRQIVGGTVPPQGYLTLTSGTPIITADVVAGTAVYYTPFTGNLVPLYDGTRFVNYEFAELTLTLASQHAIDTLYDVFVWLESGVVTIGTGPAWATITAGSCARGTGAGTTELTRTKGLHLNTVSMTARNSSTTYTVGALRATYLGSIFIDGTAGQITCHVSYGQNRKWGVWNAFNRRPIVMKAGDSTSSWSAGGAYPTFRALNNTSANKLTTFMGLPDEWAFFVAAQDLDAAASNRGGYCGIGINSTTVPSGTTGKSQAVTTAITRTTAHAVAELGPRIGINNIQMLEAIETGCTFNGTEPLCRLRGHYMG